MSTNAITPPPGYTIDPSDVQVSVNPSDVTPNPPPGYTLEQPDAASETRQMLVSGLTGMPTPNMSAQDRQNFASGKAAGAVSVPVVAASTIGAEFAPATIKAVTAMAQAHPTAAKFLAKVIGGAALGHEWGQTWKGALIGALLSGK